MSEFACDEKADLILREESRLRRIARRLTRCEADAEDLVQDTLLRAFHARERFEIGTSIRAWTRTILRRVFLTGAERARRRRMETDTDAGGPLATKSDRGAAALVDAPLPYETLVERLEDPVKRALERIPEIYRTPFLLAVVEDLSYDEISRRIEVPQGTVMSRIHRARRALRRDLARFQNVA